MGYFPIFILCMYYVNGTDTQHVLKKKRIFILFADFYSILCGIAVSEAMC